MSSLAWLVDLESSSVLLQAAQALLTAVVFGLFQRRYASPALWPWTLAWVALWAHSVGLWLLERTTSPAAAPGGAMTLLAAFTLLAGYLQLAWLLLGSYAIATGRPPAPRLWRAALGTALALAAFTTLPAASDPDGQLVRYLFRAGVYGTLCGASRVVAGIALLRWRRFGRANDPTYRWAERPELGRLIVAASFIALGALTLTSFALTAAFASAAPRADLAPTELVPVVPNANGLHLLINVKLALGLVIWLLEGEQRRAEHRAYHDPLTGLPNRQLLVDRLRHQIASSRRTRQPFAVVFIDVDHFKAVNDTLGHAAGDRLLQAVAGRLTGALREADTVARFGGDEFVVIATDLRQRNDVVGVADKLRGVMHAPVTLEGHEVCVTLSVGASVYPDDATDADALLRRSDAALYNAKEHGRDTVRFA